MRQIDVFRFFLIPVPRYTCTSTRERRNRHKMVRDLLRAWFVLAQVKTEHMHRN